MQVGVSTGPCELPYRAVSKHAHLGDGPMSGWAINELVIRYVARIGHRACGGIRVVRGPGAARRRRVRANAPEAITSATLSAVPDAIQGGAGDDQLFGGPATTPCWGRGVRHPRWR